MMRPTPFVKPISITEADAIRYLAHYAIQHHYGVALWQLPSQKEKHLVISKKTTFINRDAPIEDLSAGFVFAPFDRERPSVFLPADLKFKLHNQQLVIPENEEEASLLKRLEMDGDEAVEMAHFNFYTTESEDDNHAAALDKDHFLNIVAKGINRIEQGEFEKIVPSRRKVIGAPTSSQAIQTYLYLCKHYPNALVSLVSSPETGTWIGATPEVLVWVQDKTIFKTVALAGTQPYDKVMDVKSVAWTQKEIEEQALVERYIISCFKKIRLREYEEQGPKTVVAGNLLHLKSEFTVNMKETNFPQLGSVMLQLLHPTSAVCGMPLEPALQFLKAHEGYNREYYAGFLGPVNIENEINIFVNLRCMQLKKTHAFLYAGAGVTPDSNPEKEWTETEMKMNTLLDRIVH